LEPALLLALHCHPTHGYGLGERLRELGLEEYPTDISTIYRILYDLEERGMVTSDEDAAASAGPPRRVYALTAAGDELLRSWIGELQQTDRLLHRFLDAYARHEAEHCADGTPFEVRCPDRASEVPPASPIADNDSMEED
jgi:DNA-binding PadR family transcriptional regulator